MGGKLWWIVPKNREDMSQTEYKLFADLAELSEYAGQLCLSLAQEAVAQRGRFLWVLSGGGTPQQLYKRLAQPPYREWMPWGQIFFFWGDERSVPPEADESNYRQAKLAILDEVNVPASHVYRIKGELPPDLAAADYANQLAHVAQLLGEESLLPTFDLVLLGMGEDGHTASLFSGAISKAERTQPTLAVTAHYQNRPAHRVSLTPMLFNQARHLLFLVTGANKAEMVARILLGEADEKLPASRIHPTDGHLTWLLDSAAARLLPEAS